MIKCDECELKFPAQLMMGYLCPLCALERQGDVRFHGSKPNAMWEKAIKFARQHHYDLRHDWDLPVRMKGKRDGEKERITDHRGRFNKSWR